MSPCATELGSGHESDCRPGAFATTAWVLLLALPTLGVPARAQTPPAEAPLLANATVDRAELAPGETLVLTVEAEADAAAAVTLPELGGTTLEGAFTVASRAEPLVERAGGRQRIVQRWTLAARAAGESRVAPLRITGTLADASGGAPIELVALTPEILITVTPAGRAGTNAGAGTNAPEANGLRDIKGMVEMPRPSNALLWWLIAAANVMTIAVIVLLLRRRRRTTPLVPSDPTVAALRALDALSAVHPADATAMRNFHAELSLVVRAFLEARLQVNVTDLTTEEALAVLAARGLVVGETHAGLTTLLREADRAKFSDEPIVPEPVTPWIARARALVATTVSAP